MQAALLLADRGLAERLLEDSFDAQAEGLKKGGSRDAKAALEETRKKVLRVVDSCAQMLSGEPPERSTEYWGQVSSSRAPTRASVGRANRGRRAGWRGQAAREASHQEPKGVPHSGPVGL